MNRGRAHEQQKAQDPHPRIDCPLLAGRSGCIAGAPAAQATPRPQAAQATRSVGHTHANVCAKADIRCGSKANVTREAYMTKRDLPWTYRMGWFLIITGIMIAIPVFVLPSFEQSRGAAF